MNEWMNEWFKKITYIFPCSFLTLKYFFHWFTINSKFHWFTHPFIHSFCFHHFHIVYLHVRPFSSILLLNTHLPFQCLHKYLTGTSDSTCLKINSLFHPQSPPPPKENPQNQTNQNTGLVFQYFLSLETYHPAAHARNMEDVLILTSLKASLPCIHSSL